MNYNATNKQERSLNSSTAMIPSNFSGNLTSKDRKVSEARRTAAQRAAEEMFKSMMNIEELEKSGVNSSEDELKINMIDKHEMKSLTSKS